jgi:hypothetical protein
MGDLVAGVVGVIREDGEGAVDLFGENGAGELMGKRDLAEGENKGCAGSRGHGPSVGGADGEDEGLRAGVAEAADVLGEGFARELLAARVEQDEDGSCAGGLLVEGGEQIGFGGEGLGVAGEVTSGTGKIIGGKGSGVVGLAAGASWVDCDEQKLHAADGIKRDGIDVVTGRKSDNYE